MFCLPHVAYFSPFRNVIAVDIHIHILLAPIHITSGLLDKNIPVQNPSLRFLDDPSMTWKYF